MKQRHDLVDARIASPHWEACETCENAVEDGCILEGSIAMSVYLGDFIICDDYDPKEVKP